MEDIRTIFDVLTYFEEVSKIEFHRKQPHSKFITGYTTPN